MSPGIVHRHKIHDDSCSDCNRGQMAWRVGKHGRQKRLQVIEKKAIRMKNAERKEKNRSPDQGNERRHSEVIIYGFLKAPRQHKSARRRALR